MALSVLIPGYRPTFLRQALASVLAQDVDDMEILVSDDSGSDALAPLLARFGDPRIRFIRTAGRIGAQANCVALWREARFDLIKYVFDDDVLMPHALPTLLDAAMRFPTAAFWFGTRNVIDQAGMIRMDPRSLGKPVLVTDAATMAKSLLPSISNPVGEFTSVLMNRKVAPSPDLFTDYAGFAIRVLGDVAFFLQATRRGHAVGVDRCVASFRRHSNQQSSVHANPDFAVGLAEWELFVRGERMIGHLDVADARRAVHRLGDIYRGWADRLPALWRLLDQLGELEERVAGGDTDLLDGDFAGRWAAFLADVRAQGGPHV